LLLEREGELVQLGAILSGTRSGRGRVVLIEGPAGIGKTRLLDEMGDRARGLGLEVLAARGGELERGYGLGVVRQLLEASVVRASGQERRDLFSGAAALAEAVFSVSPATSSAGADAHQTVLHGLYWMVANLAERRPLLLAIDDLHWVDGPSLRFLLYLARRLRGMPVALVLSLRSGEVGDEPELLRALRLEADPPALRPRALSSEATAMLAATHLGCDVPADLGRACHEATGGNPFLLIELLHQLRDGAAQIEPSAVARIASERIAAALLLRIGRVGPSAPALVRATSVLGESAELEIAAALASVDCATAAALADALARVEVFKPSVPSEPLRFVHPLVRTAVYEDMPRSERSRLHGRAADVLRGRRRGAEAAAVHLLRTEPAGDEGTVELLRQAARATIARGAPESAVELLRRAEREPPPETVRPALLHELGAAASRAGHRDGLDLLREAFRLTTRQPARAIVGLELAFALGVSRSESTEGIEVLERARDGLADEELRTLIDARLMMFANCLPAARARLAAHLQEIRAAADRPPSEARLVLLSTLSADLAFTAAATADAVQLAEQALADGQVMRRDIAMEFDFAMAAVWVLMEAGRLRAAKRHLDDGIAHARARGSPFAVARIACFRALVSWRLGELQAAESDAETALSVVAAWGIPHAISTAVLAAIRIEHGDLDAARAVLNTLDTDPAVVEVTPSQIVREIRAALSLAEGHADEALAELAAYARWEQQAGLGRNIVPVAWRPVAALAQRQLGRIDEARELAAHELTLARHAGALPRLGIALRALGILQGGSGGVALLEEAASVLERSGARLEHARALVDLGALLR
ncbi:MAG: AAA family ATPase, partial [Actinomycetota bacterium]|nr:AAA family ATPase [Actinomycetota bacterium]